VSDERFLWRSSCRTDTGAVRSINEDACLERPEIGLWVVADGMGGHSAGDLAAQAVVRVLADLPAADSLSGLVDAVEERLTDLNAELREMALREQVHTIGSTVAALLARDGFCVCLWAGDSRIYRYRSGCLERLTQDHALVEELVEEGVIPVEHAAEHPQSNLVTRAVGATDRLYLDLEIDALRDGDVYLLSSDGLERELDDTTIAGVTAREPVEGLADALVELAVARGARDNVTVVAIDVRAHDAGEAAPRAGA